MRILCNTNKYLHLHDENSYLKKLNEIFEKTNEVARVGGWMVDLVNNQIHWTKVTKDIHEVDEDFVPSMQTGLDFYLEGENRDRITRIFTEVAENGGSYIDNFQILTAKGHIKWVKVFGNAEQEAGRTIRVYGAFQDITEQKLKENELKLTQSRFRDIFDNSPLGIILIDPKTNEVYHTNESAKKIFGLESLPSEEIQKFSFQNQILKLQKTVLKLQRSFETSKKL